MKSQDPLVPCVSDKIIAVLINGDLLGRSAERLCPFPVGVVGLQILPVADQELLAVIRHRMRHHPQAKRMNCRSSRQLVRVEHLNAVVFGVGNVQLAHDEADVPRHVELPWLAAGLANRSGYRAVVIHADDPVIATVGDPYLAVVLNCYSQRVLERILAGRGNNPHALA